jgi:hypothetical protein
MSKTMERFSPEVHEQAVRTVLEHERDYSSRWSRPWCRGSGFNEAEAHCASDGD